ncbi:MAG: hypothetical protein IH845_05665 [Nanoarchaeota archaeon]|nr:hypothetical protein [Nanoarchaeota archaeon]
MAFQFGEYNCEGCGIYKMITKREFDGKILCKKCMRNRPLKLFTKPNVEAQP